LPSSATHELVALGLRFGSALPFQDNLTTILWRGTSAGRDRIEYWAAGVEAYFDAAGAGQPPHNADRPITHARSAQGIRSVALLLVDETMAYKEHMDWRVRK
jgi:hypothetical protein